MHVWLKLVHFYRMRKRVCVYLCGGCNFHRFDGFMCSSETSVYIELDVFECVEHNKQFQSNE